MKNINKRKNLGIELRIKSPITRLVMFQVGKSFLDLSKGYGGILEFCVFVEMKFM